RDLGRAERDADLAFREFHGRERGVRRRLERADHDGILRGEEQDEREGGHQKPPSAASVLGQRSLVSSLVWSATLSRAQVPPTTPQALPKKSEAPSASVWPVAEAAPTARPVTSE